MEMTYCCDAELIAVPAPSNGKHYVASKYASPLAILPVTEVNLISRS